MYCALLALLCLMVYFILDRLIRSFTIYDYESKSVLITGCDSGFGKIIALRLDKLGFHVFAGCLTKDGQTALKNESSDRLRPFHLNVCSAESIKESFNIVKQALQPNKGLWALVNNAGIGGQLGPPDLNTVEGVRHTLDVNLYGPVEMCRLFLPLVRQSKGRIVNTTSMCGRFPAAEGPYCASKYGLEGYSDILRREVYREGIKVSMLEPDYFKTDILKTDTLVKDVFQRMEYAPQDVKTAYGDDFFKMYSQKVARVVGEADSDLTPVINAYMHAITAKYPRTRYVIGLKARLFFIPMSYAVPDCVANFLFPKLVALKERK